MIKKLEKTIPLIAIYIGFIALIYWLILEAGV